MVINRIPNPVLRNNMAATRFEFLSQKTSLQVLDYRNHPSIRPWMDNTELIEESQHFQFVQRLANDPANIYWLVQDQNTSSDLGVIYLNNICRTQCELGIYVNPIDPVPGTGTQLAEFALWIAFEILNLNEVTLSVKLENQRALGLYRKVGFVETEVIDRQMKMTITRQIYFSRQAKVVSGQ